MLNFLKNKKRKCNHNPENKKTTLRQSNKIHMIYPPRREYFCENCHKFFTFVDDE